MESTAAVTDRDIEVAAALRTVIHRLVKLLRRQTHAEGQLSLTERSVMGSLYQHGELAPSALAQLEKVTTQSMSQIINHLDLLELVDKAPSGEDKRMVLLSLTAKGKRYVEDNRQRKQEWLAQALHQKVSAAEKEVLMDALKILIKIIEE
ncbi:MAG TPA: MarR family transcriptional regulator [Puia sp.]|jgi:DNA-binding MarR family transcriptional regulator|nr:MarR family transcriptional regulator [Puia sp.]